MENIELWIIGILFFATLISLRALKESRHFAKYWKDLYFIQKDLNEKMEKDSEGNHVDLKNSKLPIQRVSNCASICSFKEVKDIWNAAEKHVLHEMGEVCKGDANYEEDTPDLNTYYERHYY